MVEYLFIAPSVRTEESVERASQALDDIPFLRLFSPEQRLALVRVSEYEQCEGMTVVTWQGRRGAAGEQKMYIVLSGSVSVHMLPNR